MSYSDEGLGRLVDPDACTMYQCRSLGIGADVLSEILEPTLLAATNLPNVEYPTDGLGDDLVKSGALSKLELEGILYACQRHQRVRSGRWHPRRARVAFVRLTVCYSR
jgi:hypothetical protein